DADVTPWLGFAGRLMQAGDLWLTGCNFRAVREPRTNRRTAVVGDESSGFDQGGSRCHSRSPAPHAGASKLTFQLSRVPGLRGRCTRTQYLLNLPQPLPG